MNFDNFINIVANNYLWFSRLDSMEDATEGCYKDINLLTKHCPRGNSYKKMEMNIQNEYKKQSEIESFIRNNFFISCWSIGSDENFALWKIFTEKNNGIAIKSNVQNILDSIQSEKIICHGKVEYEKKISSTSNFHSYCYTKNIHYKYENEYRFIVKEIEQSNKKHITVGINYKSIIEEIFFSPYVEKWKRNIFIDIIKRFDNSLVNKIKPSKIQLKNESDY
jgi:hypothetical protein